MPTEKPKVDRDAKPDAEAKVAHGADPHVHEVDPQQDAAAREREADLHGNLAPATQHGTVAAGHGVAGSDAATRLTSADEMSSLDDALDADLGPRGAAGSKGPRAQPAENPVQPAQPAQPPNNQYQIFHARAPEESAQQQHQAARGYEATNVPIGGVSTSAGAHEYESTSAPLGRTAARGYEATNVPIGGASTSAGAHEYESTSTPLGRTAARGYEGIEVPIGGHSEAAVSGQYASAKVAGEGASYDQVMVSARDWVEEPGTQARGSHAVAASAETDEAFLHRMEHGGGPSDDEDQQRLDLLRQRGQDRSRPGPAVVQDKLKVAKEGDEAGDEERKGLSSRAKLGLGLGIPAAIIALGGIATGIAAAVTHGFAHPTPTATATDDSLDNQTPGTITVSVLTNDTFEGTVTVVVETTSEPGVGTWSVNSSNQVVFTPDLTMYAFQTPATTTYHLLLSDGVTTSNSAKITIGFELPPSAVALAATLDPGPLAMWSHTFTGAGVTVTPVSGAITPGFTFSGQTITFKPTGYSQPVTQKYQLSLGAATSNQATITISFAIGAASPFSKTGLPHTKAGPFEVRNPDAIAGNATVSLSDPSGAWTVDSMNQVSFTPPSGYDFTVPATISYHVQLGTMAATTSTITLQFLGPIAADLSATVDASGSANFPVASRATLSSGETIDVASIVFTGFAPAPGQSPAPVAAVPFPNALFLAESEGDWLAMGTTGKVQFTPLEFFKGAPTPVRYTIKDTAGNVSNVATLTVTAI